MWCYGYVLKIIRVKLNEREECGSGSGFAAIPEIWNNRPSGAHNLLLKLVGKAIQIVTKFIKKKKREQSSNKTECSDAHHIICQNRQSDRRSWWTQSPQVLLSSKGAPRAENRDIRVSLISSLSAQWTCNKI